MPITSNRSCRCTWASAIVENCGPSMQTYVPRRCTFTLAFSLASDSTPATCARFREAFHRIQAAAADDSDLGARRRRRFFRAQLACGRLFQLRHFTSVVLHVAELFSWVGPPLQRGDVKSPLQRQANKTAR